MYNYICRRCLLMVPTLIGIITIVFVISEFVPGGPVDQIQAMLDGDRVHGGGEVAQGTSTHDLKRRSDPKLEARLRRNYGLNHSPFTRYLRTLLWFGADSITSDAELGHFETAKFHSRGRQCIVLRDDDDYYAFHNAWPEKGERGEVVFDRTRGQFRSVIDDVYFDRRTGVRVGGGIGLDVVPLRTRHIDDGGREVFVDEPFADAVTNWDNWHGFFLLKFGDSISYNKTVVELVKERLPVSMSLGIVSFFLTYTVCLLLGIAKAVRNGSRFDALTSVVVLFGYSIPGFVLAVLLIVLFGPGDGHIVDIIPLAGLTSSDVAGYADWSWWRKLVDYLHHLITPILCLTVGSFATLTMLTKNSILEQINQQYVTTARAKGLSEPVVLYKHVLRNALIPLVTGFPSSFLAMFFSGSLLIEKIFSLNGLGLLGYESVINRDFPVVMGSLFIFTIIGLIGQLLTDISYVIVDPRISFDQAS